METFDQVFKTDPNQGNVLLHSQDNAPLCFDDGYPMFLKDNFLVYMYGTAGLMAVQHYTDPETQIFLNFDTNSPKPGNLMALDGGGGATMVIPESCLVKGGNGWRFKHENTGLSVYSCDNFYGVPEQNAPGSEVQPAERPRKALTLTAEDREAISGYKKAHKEYESEVKRNSGKAIPPIMPEALVGQFVEASKKNPRKSFPVCLARGLRPDQVRKLVAGGKDADTTRPTEQQARDQVGEKESPDLVEFTSRAEIALQFAGRGKGNYVVAVEIEARYLEKGSVAEGGWVCRATAPVKVLWKQQM
ncbi:DUF4765 family protein [Streptomyces sp. NPDC089919]|uniref:DUF4765 family protein n=1 Tax=Streptomyces sp. NPDC089919 TaxID=3155188 RepID=UPI00341E6001